MYGVGASVKDFESEWTANASARQAHLTMAISAPPVVRDVAPVAAGAERKHIVISGLCKKFGNQVLYDNLNLDIKYGKIVSVFGPNGCGKSTLINMISGITPFDSGRVLFDGKTLAETRIGYVFQNYREAVFPWLRAIDNIRYPLQFLKLSKRERDERVERLLATFDVKLNLNLYPYQMSGGQQQLVSIMRAMVVDRDTHRLLSLNTGVGALSAISHSVGDRRTH